MYTDAETGKPYDPMKDKQFEAITSAYGDGMEAFRQIVKHGKPLVLGLAFEEAHKREIPANATFVGNLTWPQNAYDGTNMDHLVSSMRSWGMAAVGPPGTKRDHLKSEQGDYGPKHHDQVGFYYVFKDAPKI